MAFDERIAVYPGSYDPITNGHLDVITRAAAVFHRVIVAVVNVPPRKGGTLFTTEERIGFIEEATAHFGNVEVDKFDTLIVRYAEQRGATAIVKGLRAISDFEYEFEMNQLNRMLAPGIESVFIMASPQYSFLSSSGVKEIARFGGEIRELVPASVAERLKEALAR